jgi:hypothetical protein
VAKIAWLSNKAISKPYGSMEHGQPSIDAWKQGRWDDAEELEVQVMETRKTKLGVDHPHTLTNVCPCVPRRPMCRDDFYILGQQKFYRTIYSKPRHGISSHYISRHSKHIRGASFHGCGRNIHCLEKCRDRYPTFQTSLIATLRP